MREFTLVSRPWILTRRLDGRIGEVGLEELFATAHGLRTIVGEVPTQTFALMRLLLAILHRATDGPADGHAWGALWRDPMLPVADVADYLGAFRDRFDLLHPVTPFYQVADLRTTKGEVFGLDRLIADVPTGEPFFTTRLKAGVERISPAEAARWVVHCQAFDPSGIKSGAVGDPRVKNGKGYPIGTGWAGSLGGVFVEGRTLRETLLLNLIPAAHLRSDDRDLPVWERPPQTECEEVPGGREPYGPLDLYTWQSRRIRLVGDGDAVTGVIVANGDQLRPQNRHDLEPLSAWRRSQAQEKALKRPLVYMPREHDPERAIWRGLAALLPAATPVQASGPADALAPAVLGWIGQAHYRGDLAADQHVRARAVGMRYGSQQATTIEIVDDAMDMAVALLAERHRELAAAAVTAVEHADTGAAALGYLAANLAEAAGGDGAGPKDRAREQAYATLDAPFRHWLAGLDPPSDPREALEAWHETAHRILLDLGRELVDRAGPAAWVGRLVGPEGRQRHVSTPEADIWYRRQIRKTFELASTPERTGGIAMTTANPPDPAVVSQPTGGRRQRPPLRAVGRFVDARVTQLQRGYLERRPGAVATLAQLRRGVGKPVGAVAELWQATLEGVPLPPRYGDAATDNERAAYTALTLYALHQQSRGEPMHQPGQSIGTAARVLSRRAPSENATRRRFEALGTASTFEEVTHHARGLVSQFRSHGVPLDYGQLADQLVWLLRPATADRVRLAWGRDFYRLAVTDQPTAAAAAAQPTGEAS